MFYLKDILNNDFQVIFFGYARTALEYGYKYLGIRSGDEILYPDYICDVTMVSCNNLGIEVKFYKVKDNLEPDFTSVRDLVTKKTKAFLAVHYFGFPAPVEQIKTFCNEYDLFFIEDCAHSFLTKINNQPVGSFGNIAILSFRKTIPLVNGAALIINQRIDTLLFKNIQKEVELLSLEENGIKRVKAYLHRLETLYSIPFSRLRKGVLNILPHGSTETEDLPYRIDPKSLAILSKIDFQKEKQKRREGYKNWVDTLIPKGFTPVFNEFGEGVVPMVCPLYVEDRDKWLKYFFQRRVKVTTWPTLPSWVSKDSRSAVDIWKKLIAFPL